jgi:alpha-glucosidase
VTEPWWQTGVVYQIYPRSFADADADGVGDLPGITAHLDYVASLGVDAVWLSPIFRSPMADFGYDISDYCDVDPLFGTLDDLDALVEQAHPRDLKVILDLVPNHTSDEHPWFAESRASRDNPKRDWYLWRDPAPDGSVPNNWPSFFGGPAWEFDETTGQYYLHLFHRKQPDLNWHNPEVREAVYDVMRFWLDRGIDGFRIDVLWLLAKDETFADSPPVPPREHELDVARLEHPGFEDREETHQIVREMRALVDEYDHRVLIGEIYLPFERLVHYYGERLDGVHLPFNFGLVTASRFDAPTIRRLVQEYEGLLPGGAWPNWVLGNHDISRIATRAGDGRAGGTRLSQMLLLTLRGTPTCYYGDELGLPDGEIPPERVVDPQAAAGRNRDPARTPMPWDASPTAGFSPDGVEPWLPLAAGHERRNVEVQAADPHSELSLFRALTGLRRARRALQLGSLRLLDGTEPDDVLAYVRDLDGELVLVALHFGDTPRTVDLSAAGAPAAGVLLSTELDRAGVVDLGALELRPREGVIVSLR